MALRCSYAFTTPIKQVIGVLKAEFGDELLVSEARQPTKMCPLCAEDGER